MTPDQIHTGHTYELTSGTHWTVKSFIENGRSIIITDGEVTTYDTPHNFACYAVRDVTMAPESDQVEKVAQAQSQGPSRGDGVAMRGSAAAVDAELLEAARAVASQIDYLQGLWGKEAITQRLVERLESAIASAEAANDPPRFRHRRTGDIYELLLIANEHAERTAQYPPTAVYRRLSDQTVWSRPVQDWGKDFEEVSGE